MVRRVFGTVLSISLVAAVILAGGAASAGAATVTSAPEVVAGGLGGRGAINVAVHVAGSEYGGFPDPTTAILLDLPPGTAIGAGDHRTCSMKTLETVGPAGCPAGSRAGPVSEVLAIVAFGPERVEETGTLESFFAPVGGLSFFVDGHSPVSLEILMSATVSSNVVTVAVPLVSTVPGAPYASLEALDFRIGETPSEEATTHLQSGLTVSAKCARGEFSWSAAVTLDEGGANPVVPNTYETAAESACPGISPEEVQRIRQREAEGVAQRKAGEEAAARKQAEEEIAAKRKVAEEASRHAEEALHTAIVAALDRGIALSAKEANIATLLKAGGLSVLFKASTGGTLAISWYEVPKGARLSAKAKPVLVATGRLNFTWNATRKLTIRLTSEGRQLLKRAKTIRVTAKGVFTPTGKAPVIAARAFTLER
jgi:hypothetical protein